MVFPELTSELSRTELSQKVGERLSQAGALASDHRADHDEEDDNQHEQARVDHGNGASATAENSLQACDQGAHQVGEEDGEQKRDERGSGDIKKSEPQREQQRRDDYPRRT